MIVDALPHLAIGSFLLALAAFLAWRRRMDRLVAESADMAWEKYQRRDPQLLEGLDRARFDAIHRRAEYPRFPAYVLATFGALIVSTPVILVVLAVAFAIIGGDGPSVAASFTQFVFEGGEARAATEASDVAKYYAYNLGGFGYFFGLLFGWLVVVGVVMRRYHETAPDLLRDELIRARAAADRKPDHQKPDDQKPDDQKEDR